MPMRVTFLPPRLRTRANQLNPSQLIVGDDQVRLYRVKERFSMHDYLPGMGPAAETPSGTRQRGRRTCLE